MGIMSKMALLVVATTLGCAQSARSQGGSGAAVAAGGEDVQALANRKLMQTCANTYQQCGGQNAESRECCEPRDTCTVLNPFYSQCVPSPPSPGEDCAVQFDVCGGRFSPTRDCCRRDNTCVFINEFYSQCQPDIVIPPGGPGDPCTDDDECSSGICDSGTDRCNFPCDPSLQQEVVNGECTCQAGFLDVNTGDGTFCAALCALSQMPCSTDSDCCDSNVNVSCEDSKCTVAEGTCGSNQSEDSEGECKCNEGFIDVASNNMGISAPDPFCVPNCTVTGNLCTSASSCCSQFGKVGFCMIMDGDTEGICALTPTGPTTARIAESVEETVVEEVPQDAGVEAVLSS